MKIHAVLDADLDRTPLGTASRLADDLGGVPTLRRTVERVAACQTLDAITVICPPEQKQRTTQLLAGTPARVRARSAPTPPFRNLVRTARKWSLDGWRGGLGGSSSLDEYVDPIECAVVASESQADAIAVFPPGAALVDPQLTDEMIDHAREHEHDARLTFAQAPPGLLPIVLQSGLCGQLAEKNVPPGWALAYKPDDPAIDLVFRPCNFPVAQAVRYASGRLAADTSRSWRTMQRILSGGARDDAVSVATYLGEHAAFDPGALPREVEIELTTDDRLPNATLRPRGDRVPRRGPLDLKWLDRVARELANANDDALVVLGGFGDPLCHPQFEQALAVLRAAGVYGIAVYTTGQGLSDAELSVLLRHKVDVVAFQLDAWTDATYQTVSGGASPEPVKQAIARLSAARQQANQVEPIIVPLMTKASVNVEELDAFYDGWMRSQGCASITGSSHYGGRLDDLRVVDMAPPQRRPCQRIFSRCVILADGRVAACDQDFAGDLVLGDLKASNLTDIWTGPAATNLRHRHLEHHYTDGPLCAACNEWHRP